MANRYIFGKTEIAILGIVAMEIMALYKGLDGVFLTTAIGTVAAIAGYALSEKLNK